VNINSNKNLNHNILVNLLDGGFFGFAIGFASFTTIIPLFVSSMTTSAVLIGLVPAIHNMGWMLPQLLTAKKISSLSQLRDFVVRMSIHERLPFVGLTLIAFFQVALGTKIALAFTFILLIYQGIGSGLTANAWQNMIGNVIPAQRLATFFGAQSALANLLASVGAVTAGYILQNYPQNKGFTLCFLFACLLMVISWFCLGSTRETPREISNVPIVQESLIRSTILAVKNNHDFGWFLIARNMSQFGLMALAFFTVYAVQYHHASETIAGVLTSTLMITQMLANPIMGYIADKWSRKWVMVFGSFCNIIAAIVAWKSLNITWLIFAYILIGISNTIFWVVGMTFSMGFGTEKERPKFVGMSNTLIAPSAILAPVLGGWLADIGGYSTTFIVASLASLATMFIYILKIKEPRRLIN
jgi:MFS family permease